MKDQFDLKKFLTENKTIENSNPFLKEEKEEKKLSKKEEKSLKKISKQLKKSVKAHGVQAKTIDKALKEEEMSDAEETEIRKDVDAVRDDLDQISKLAKDAGEDAEDIKSTLKERIREMIINELSEDTELEEDGFDPEGFGDMNYRGETTYMEEGEESLEEAKEDEEEIETDESEDEGEAEEEISAEEETEETEETTEEPETGGGLEDIAADMEGDEGDLMDHLISALKVSKAMDNEKLTTQIGNTLKFFVGEYIGGEE